MHFTAGQASLFAHKLEQALPDVADVEVVVCPHFLALQPLSLQLNRRKLHLGAQNCYYRDEGAYTGEVSATMLRHMVEYVLVGHSERRHIFNETDHDIAQKVQAVLRNDMQPIICIGETKDERDNGETAAVLHGQISSALSEVSADEIKSIVIAYEPVWAIGSGHPDTPDDLVDIVRHIRKQVASLFGAEAGTSIRVIYGGSSSGNDAAGFLAVPGINGLLVGAASLKVSEFVRMAEAAH